MSRTYYITQVHFDGGTTGPTRLLMIDTDKQALAKMKSFQKSYPESKFILEREGDGTYATWKSSPLDRS